MALHAPRPEYVQRRIDLAAQRRQHRQQFGEAHSCPSCAPKSTMEAALAAKLAAQRARNGEAPF